MFIQDSDQPGRTHSLTIVFFIELMIQAFVLSNQASILSRLLFIYAIAWRKVKLLALQCTGSVYSKPVLSRHSKKTKQNKGIDANGS